MEPESRNRISDLYHAALERAPEERSAFLKEACSGNDALREEVESLLCYELASSRFLEQPAAVVAAGVVGEASMVNRQLGPYTIVGPLGAGGMGEVYRAHDSKLGRDVAIKILPSRFTADPERCARFAREARLLGTLNHPHIGAIYGLEESEGRTALVLELVEGPTLAARLKSGPLPLAEALTIARQVAEALEAAHKKGIVHRDLKPGNIVLQGASDVAGVSARELRAKVLDFGLAKAIDSEADADGGHSSGSVTSTADGRIFGTPAYMSPEQGRGLPVDKRTDIWALGCVLYEMLAGRRPFDGTTPADTVARVLEHEPDWSAIPAATPENIRKLLRRCLEKDPSHRLRDIGDARLDLEDAAAPRPSMSAAWPPVPWRAPRRALLAGAGLLVLAALFWVPLRRSQPEPPAQVSRLTFDEGLQTDPALAPDGRFVAYASDRAGNFDLYAQPVSGGNPVRVTEHPAHDWQPDWSGSDQIVFRSERDGGALYVVGPTGGHERRVAPFGERPLWSPDGTKILFGRLPSLMLYTVGLDGAPPRSCDQCYGGLYGWFGDANHIATLSTGPNPQHQPLFRVIELESGAVEAWTTTPAVASAFRRLGLVFGRTTLAFDPNGRAFYFSGSSGGTSVVWKLDIDPNTRSLTGGPHRVATMAEDTAGVTIARATGAIAFAAAARIPRIAWYSLDPSGRRITGPPEAMTSRELPPSEADITLDGSRLVFSVRRPGGPTAELRIKLLSERVERPLRVSDVTRGEQRQQPRFSSDGKHVVFRYVHPGSGQPREGHPLLRPQQLRLLDVDTNEESELTTTAPRLVTPGGFSPDGRFVVASVDRALRQDVRSMSIALLPIAAAPKAESQMKIVTTHEGQSGLLQPVMAPNGRWIAFEVQGHTARIAVLGSTDALWSEPQQERSWRYLDPLAMYGPRWSVDGRLLYFISMHGGLANVWAVDFDPVSGDVGKPFQVTKFNGQGEQMPLALGMSAVARGGLAVRTVRPTGGIWLLDRPR